MKIKPTQLALSLAIAVGVVWAFCGLVVYLSPGFMTDMTGHMIHMDISDVGLTMSLRGMFMGLIGWIVLAGGFGWALGLIYNRLNQEKQ